MEEIKLRKYVFIKDNEYIIGCYSVIGNEYDYKGQMALHMNVIESFKYGGWYKYNEGEFILDEERKAEMLKKWEEENNVS